MSLRPLGRAGLGSDTLLGGKVQIFLPFKKLMAQMVQMLFWILIWIKEIKLI